MKQLTLRLDTSFRNRESKYFDSLVGQIENPDRLSASEAEKKRAADGILEISIWKRGRAEREGAGALAPPLRISSTRKRITDYRLRWEILPGSMRGIVSLLLRNSVASLT